MCMHIFSYGMFLKDHNCLPGRNCLTYKSWDINIKEINILPEETSLKYNDKIELNILTFDM